MVQLAELEHGLFLGTMHAAADRPLLGALGVTHVVNLSPADCPDHFDAQISYLRVQHAEAAGHNLGHCLRFVHAALSVGGCVLLHCRMALSRSPCIAAAYLMWTAQTPMSVAEAMLRVRAVWPRMAPCDADLAILVELELELAERPVSELPLPVAADVDEVTTEPIERPMDLCEPEPEGVSAQSSLLFDGQQPDSIWQAFAARWAAAASSQERRALRVAALDGCRQQLDQCIRRAGQPQVGSRSSLVAGAVLQAATLIRTHEAAAVAALSAAGVSPASAEGLRIARSHGWSLALESADEPQQAMASTAAPSTSDALAKALLVALWGEAPDIPDEQGHGEDGVWIWTEITRHLRSQRLSCLLAAYARALDQRLSCRLAGASTNSTAAAVAELELRRLQQTVGGMRRIHIPGEGQGADADSIAQLEVLIGEVSLMEEPARRWCQQQEEREASTHGTLPVADAEGPSREPRPRLWPLVLARAAAGQTPSITAASNAAVLQHHATLLLPDSVVAELGDFAAWFSSDFQHGRVVSLLPGRGYAELGMSGRVSNGRADGQGLQSHRSFEWGGRLICVSIPSLSILYALIQMLQQPAPSILSSGAGVGEVRAEQGSYRDAASCAGSVNFGDLVAVTGLTMEAALLAILPLVVTRTKKKSRSTNKKVTKGQNDRSVDQSRAPRLSSEKVGLGLVTLHADPAGGSARADGGLFFEGAGESDSEGPLALARSWRVSLNCSFVPAKPRTPMLPAVDAKIGSDAGAAIQVLRGQLQHDLLLGAGTEASRACNAADAGRNDEPPSRMGVEGERARGGVSLKVRKVVPVCLWDRSS